MNRNQTLIFFFAALLGASCAPSNNVMQSSSQKGLATNQLDEISEIVSQMPADDKTEWEWLNGRLFEMGAPAMHVLVGMLNTSNNGNDTKARYAVNGLAKYVSRPGADAEQAVYEQVIISELKKDHPVPVDLFLMEQLELTGSNAAVPVLQSFLGDKAFNTSAAHALRNINTEQAVDALAEGLSKSEGAQQVVLIKALGDMKASKSRVAQQISPLAEKGDSAARDAVLYTLASSGNPGASETLISSGVVQYQLKFAQRLAEEGYSRESAEIARDIYSSDNPVHIRIAALNILFEAEGEVVPDLLLEAARDSNSELRSAALKLARNYQGSEITNEFIEELDQNGPAVQADIIEMLGQRGDSSAWPAVKTYLRAENPKVRISAVHSAVSLAGTEAIPSLLTSLNGTAEQKEINAIKTALLQLPPEPVYAAASQRWMNLSSDARVALIEIVAERQTHEYLDDLLDQLSSSNQQIRLAILESAGDLAKTEDLPRLLELLNQAQNDQEVDIIQEAIAHVANSASDDEDSAASVIGAFQKSSGNDAANLVEILPMIGGQKALEAVISATNDSDREVQTAAKRALAHWPEAAAIQPLQDVINNSPTPEREILIEGYIRLVGNSRYSDSDKVQFLIVAMESASTDELKISLLNALSSIHSTASLKAISGYFKDGNKAVRDEAFHAAAQILAPSYDFSTDFDDTDKVLSVLEAMTDSNTKQQIETYIGEIQTRQHASEGFTSLFNGENLSGWTGATNAYVVRDGHLVHREGASGNLFTEEEYSDFILRFEFKLTPGANNGLAIRSPLQGDPAYEAMELQILDNTADKYSDLQPYQYHGSVYGVAPAERGHLKPVGEWNTQEVIANGSQITVKLNGVTILDTNIEEAGSPETADGKDHPGLLRTNGHVGFLGHGDEVAFRNIRIRDLNVYYPDYSTDSDADGGMNTPPEGFKALFNGESLEGWKGLVANPEERANMSTGELASAQAEADRVMQEHWSVRDGILFFDGRGESLATEENYKDFEMLLDWKIEPHGDSGVYLRGSPQVQIWDITENPVGSGGLYNNQEHPSDPRLPADNPIGEWNRMRIKMIGERVTVHLNGELAVANVVMENYWDREKPIYSEGQIELQAHNTPLYFRNIFIREIPRKEPLFNGQDLTGWEPVDGGTQSESAWHAKDGTLQTQGGDGWLSTSRQYDNFKLELEYRLPDGGNSGIFLRAPREGDPAYEGIEIQLLDDYSPQYSNLDPRQYTASIYDVKAPSQRVSKKAGEWQHMIIVANGPNLKVIQNGMLVINTSLVNFMDRVVEHPGLKRRKGYIGLQNHNSKVEFRNIEITEIK